MPYKCVIFDLDGTLLDSLGPIIACIQSTATAMHLEVPKSSVIRSGIGLTVEDQIQRLFPKLDLQKKTCFLSYFKELFYETKDEIVLFPGVVETLKALESHQVFTAIATDMPRRGLELLLQSTSLGRLVGYARCASDGFAKPNPQMVIDILDFYAIEPSEAVMVGDTEFDLQTAQNAGVACIAVDYGAHEIERLKAHKPLCIIESIDDVLGVVGLRAGQ